MFQNRLTANFAEIAIQVKTRLSCSHREPLDTLQEPQEPQPQFRNIKLGGFKAGSPAPVCRPVTRYEYTGNSNFKQVYEGQQGIG